MLPFGEIVLVRIAFHQATGGKIRPAVVLLDTGDEDFVAAPVTSQVRFTPYDIAIQGWHAAGLNTPSFIRVHKLTVLSNDDVLRRIEVLDPSDVDGLRAVLAQAFRAT